MIAACAPLRDLFIPSAPRVPGEWAALIEELRTYERRIGFETTANFLQLSEERSGYAYCGYAPRLILPYSYEDPAIRWRHGVSEEDCRTLGDGNAFFGVAEALGEVGTPVTPSMITSKLDRFVYVVIHEDCHDQFELPYGIEEALCNLITYNAMEAFAEERFGASAREERAIRRYADAQSRQTRVTITVYGQLSVLHARYERKELTAEAFLWERSRILTLAQRSLSWKSGIPNSVGIANHMTYSRHYPFLENVFDALERDLARTVAFFRRVDAMKPSRAAVMKQYAIAKEESVEFIRAYEAAVVKTIEEALAERQLR
ncbi:MAG TPA: hypothetical protein VKF40_20795 [Burkholderiales bacterium]|nr:hypothetical protein [Burkholderiales bacterium]